MATQAITRIQDISIRGASISPIKATKETSIAGQGLVTEIKSSLLDRDTPVEKFPEPTVFDENDDGKVDAQDIMIGYFMNEEGGTPVAPVTQPSKPLDKYEVQSDEKANSRKGEVDLQV